MLPHQIFRLLKKEIMFDIKKDFDFIPCKLRENSEKKKARHAGVWIIIVNLACLYY